MSNLVIVAIPEDDDPVWKVSSEKVPHVTLLYLGSGEGVDLERVTEFLEHAVSTTLTRFMLDVDHRGTLGPDEADVVFFEGWDLPALSAFRADLLKNDAIKIAYDSEEQYEEFLPHLTLGYPETPAHNDAYDGQIRYISFDKVAIWPGDYDGPTFELPKYQYPLEVSMADTVEEFLTHHGVKGMKWGKRKASLPQGKTAVDITLSRSGKTKIKTSGGVRGTAHEDAITAALAKQRLKGSGVHALSNKELQDLANRLDLEARVNRLTTGDQSAGKKFASDLLRDIGKQQVRKAAQDAAAKQVSTALGKKK